MTTRRLIGTAAVMVLAMAAPALAQQAGPTGGNTFSSEVSAKYANASAYNEDSSGCIDNSANASAYDVTYKATGSKPARDRQLYVGLTSYNVCGDVDLLEAFGAVNPQTLKFDRNGTSVKGTVELYDYVSGNSIVVKVTLSLTTIPNTGHRWNYHDEYDPATTADYVGSENQQSVVGSINDGVNEYLLGDLYGTVGQYISTYVQK